MNLTAEEKQTIMDSVSYLITTIDGNSEVEAEYLVYAGIFFWCAFMLTRLKEDKEDNICPEKLKK